MAQGANTNGQSQPVYLTNADGSPGGGSAGPQPATGSTSVTPASDGAAFPVVGNVASGTADSGAPVKIGGRAMATAPAALTNGQRADAWYNLNGAQANFLTDAAGALVTILAPNSDARAIANTLPVLNFNHHFNGATWDRARGDITGAWTHSPPATVSTALSGTIATSGGTAAIAMTNTTRTEVINSSTGTLWASWGTPAVNGAGSFQILTGGSYSADRVAGTLTLLSTAAAQPYTVNRFS